MKREALRVEPISTYLDRWKAPASPVTRAGNMIFVSGLPPFDPELADGGIPFFDDIVAARLRSQPDQKKRRGDNEYDESGDDLADPPPRNRRHGKLRQGNHVKTPPEARRKQE